MISIRPSQRRFRLRRIWLAEASQIALRRLVLLLRWLAVNSERHRFSSISARLMLSACFPSYLPFVPARSYWIFAGNHVATCILEIGLSVDSAMDTELEYCPLGCNRTM